MSNTAGYHSCRRSPIDATILRDIGMTTVAININYCPIIPDIAAIITAMIEVTIAMPPRVRLSQTFSEAYISFAIPDRSNNEAIKINSGTEINT